MVKEKQERAGLINVVDNLKKQLDNLKCETKKQIQEKDEINDNLKKQVDNLKCETKKQIHEKDESNEKLMSRILDLEKAENYLKRELIEKVGEFKEKVANLEQSQTKTKQQLLNDKENDRIALEQEQEENTNLLSTIKEMRNREKNLGFILLIGALLLVLLFIKTFNC